MKKLSDLSDKQLCDLIEERWRSSATLWSEIEKITNKNKRFYTNEPEWLIDLPKKKSKVRANRIFTDMEAVINALIANPPKPNLVPGQKSPESKELAHSQELYFVRRYDERNVKETLRKGLRDLYFSRLIVLKPFWNSKLNDFDVRKIDPLKVRCGKAATKEQDSEFFIEEISENVQSIIKRFPKFEEYILQQAGVTEEDALIQNPEIVYKECWVKDRSIFKLGEKIIGNIRNPYWDWDGLLTTPQEQESLQSLQGEPRANAFQSVMEAQDERKNIMAAKKALAENPDLEVDEAMDMSLADQLQPYFFNYFDTPRKPYIIATVFNSEAKPIGETDMITQAAPLQESVDRRKRQIDDNAEWVNGVTLVDSTVMEKQEAQKLRFETGGVIWGKGVAAGVKRESGTPLPEFIFQDMQDSRSEIDNIMAASSAFRGERQGQETKGGRLALVEQSFLRLNEMVQVVDYVCAELFSWWYQLAKTRYTERHYAKDIGPDGAAKIIELMQNDFEDGTEVRIIPGKTLPEDKQFMFERAQKDFELGLLDPVSYFEQAGYNDPKGLAKDKFMFDANPVEYLGIKPDEMPTPAPLPVEDPNAPVPAPIEGVQ